MKFKEYYFAESTIILEGGGYGHLTHPFEDNSLTFSQMKDMISKSLAGELDTTQEKTDGQNIMITWKNGKLRAARNKGHIKNNGEKSLDIDQLGDMFKGRGEIQKAFVFAMDDLQNAIEELPRNEVEDIFENGKKFMSVEVMTPKTENVVPYDLKMLIPHGIIEYDESGNAIGEDKASAREMFKLIQATNLDTQKTFKLRPPHDISGLKVVNFKEQRDKIFKELDDIKDDYSLNDKKTLLDYKIAYWENLIKSKSEELGYEIPDFIMDNLVDRWAKEDKAFTVAKMKSEIDNPKFLEWVLSFEKDGLKQYQKMSTKPFELLFLRLGVTILKNMKKFLAMNPDESLDKLKVTLTNKIEELKKSDDPKVAEKLKKELERLEAVGGFDAIVPSEGITFLYNGKVYKLTGSFAPINTILGLGRF